MRQAYRLYKRNGIYYVRFVIPKNLKINFDKSSDIRYSLKTRDYETALTMLSLESSVYNHIIRSIITMREEKNKLYLSDNDLQTFILHRTNEVYMHCIKSKKGIKDLKFPYHRIKWLDLEKNDNAEDWRVIEKQYTKFLLKKAETDKQLQEIAKRMQEGKLHFASLNSRNEDNIEHKNWGIYLLKTLKRIEQHTKNMFEHIVSGEKYEEDDDFVNELIDTVKENNKKNMSNKLDIELNWEKVWKDYETKKQSGIEQIKPYTLKTKYFHIKTIFELLGINDLNKITEENILDLEEKLKSMKKNGKCFFSKTTINKYMCNYNELIRHAKKYFNLENVHYINTINKKAIKSERIKRAPFSDGELATLFTTKEFIEQHYDIVDFPRFWIPLISAYTGDRGNEISQMKFEDVYKDKETKKWYFRIKRPNTLIDDIYDMARPHYKTNNAYRYIPVHNVLIKLGFIDFWKQLKKAKQYRERWCKVNSEKEIVRKEKDKIVKYKPDYNPENIFFTLNYKSNGSNFAKIGQWFDRQLIKNDLKTTEIGEIHVFHSLRHTFVTNINKNTKIRDYELTEVMGWSDGSMANNYNHMDKELLESYVQSIHYPKLERRLSKLMPDESKMKRFDWK